MHSKYRYGHNTNWYYQWNAAGRMTRADRYCACSTFETYVYDAHGHRTRSSRQDGSTRYQIYSRTGQLLYTEDSRDNQRIDYIHLGGKLIAQRSRPISTTSATVTYHHTAAIQSANVETNTARTQTHRTVRTPYQARALAPGNHWVRSSACRSGVNRRRHMALWPAH